MSQNIVAKYEPTQSSDAAGSRRRKVIVVANYDSGKVRRETAGVFVRALRPLRYGALGGMVVAAVFTLLRGVVLSEGAASFGARRACGRVPCSERCSACVCPA